MSTDINSIQVGDVASCELAVSGSDVADFARLSQDTNPLHLDAATARDFGFPRAVAHGMLALGAISRLIGTQLPGPGALWISQEVQFVGPVLVGDRLTARVTVEQVSKATGVVVLRTEVVNRDSGAPILSGTAKVKVLERRVETASEKPNVKERVALVTGGSRGLGRSIALALARSGVKVLVHYHERQDAADAVVGAITGGGGQAAACRADLRDAATHGSFFEQASSVFGRVDILVNNATPPIERKPSQDCDWEDFLPYLNVYVASTFQLTKLAVPGMKARKFGRVVNVLCASACGVPPPRLVPYVTAKSALAGLSRSLAVELGPLGITVNTIAPSMLVTEQTAGIGDRARQLAASQSPLRRLADLEDVANVVDFLASDAAGYITGATIPVAGGEIMS